MKWSPWHVRQLPIILTGVFAVIRASHFHTSYVRNWIFFWHEENSGFTDEIWYVSGAPGYWCNNYYLFLVTPEPIMHVREKQLVITWSQDQ